LFKVETGLLVVHVSDTVSKEGFALVIDEPVTVFDFGQGDRGERRVLSRKWQREQEGECEEEFHGGCRDRVHFVALAGGEHECASLTRMEHEFPRIEIGIRENSIPFVAKALLI
jgi:hypothetical protein